MREQGVSFPSRDGLKLKGLVSEGEEGSGWGIICHPHSLYGGQMHNNVVAAVQRVLAERGISTLRFNFRGVGKSEGGYGAGIEEVEDVRGAVDFIAERGGAPLSLVGYSFGAAVGAKAVIADKRVKAVVCISPPIEMYDFSYLKDDTRPKLLVAGDQDFVCPVGPFEKFFDSLLQPKAAHIIPGADHFWWGFEDQAAAQVADFLKGP